jgi:hypothetical protein
VIFPIPLSVTTIKYLSKSDTIPTSTTESSPLSFIPLTQEAALPIGLTSVSLN